MDEIKKKFWKSFMLAVYLGLTYITGLFLGGAFVYYYFLSECDCLEVKNDCGNVFFVPGDGLYYDDCLSQQHVKLIDKTELTK